MRRTFLLALATVLAAAGPAAARGHRLTLGDVYKRPHAAASPKPHKPRKPKAPVAFHPVKPWKGFSYLDHEKHPEKD